MSMADDVARYTRERDTEQARVAALNAAIAAGRQQAARESLVLGAEVVKLLRERGVRPLRQVPWHGTSGRLGWLGPAEGPEVWGLRSRDLERLALIQEWPSGGSELGVREDGTFGNVRTWFHTMYPWTRSGQMPHPPAVRRRQAGARRVARYCEKHGLGGVYFDFRPSETPVETRISNGTVEAKRSTNDWIPLSQWVARAVADTLEQQDDA